ncbi:hypothetical protein AJ80_00486 [Polytolypa hystricis UAMH7299]|uniref:USP domain-containing protein n=1 Tax=Polytolypa hystricis (strain UAMH7299) TaxID=1447883 RepID=A0A2B7Z376_POLH7|nr:hypothetical protein AJ80_00486 [Polytolypa hystricis UAMH7299]
MRGPEDDAHRAEPYRNGVHGAYTDPSGSHPYHAGDDIEARTAALRIDNNVSLNELLRISEEALQKSRGFLHRGQLEHSFGQYLRASETTINAIPNHPDYQYMKQQHPAWNDRFIKLLSTIRSQEGTMSSVKQKIDANNSSVNGQPTTHSRPGSWAPSPPFQPPASGSSPPNGHNRAQSHVDRPLRMPSPSQFQELSGNPPSAGSSPDIPLSQPASNDPLAQRFADLRKSRQNRSSAIYEQTNTAPHNPQQPRLVGPREMNAPPRLPTVPPKLPMPTANPSLPRFPSPAYSPVHTIPPQQLHNPPRTSTESSRSIPYRNSSYIGNSNQSTNGYFPEDHPYRSQTPNGVHTREAPSKSAEIPQSPTILPETLFEYLRKYEVLLIDVRSRDQYDSGHIYSKSIICIEPVSLKENVSAEELEDRLVISPETEQALFARRNEFDLVVYYDQNTREASYLAGSPALSTLPHLRALYDTLYEFNLYKPLKDGRQPALLVGGIDAWVDLVGPQALGTSQTAAIMSSVRARKPVGGPARPLRRFPTASANSSWEVRKRRLREYTPLNPEEERAWLEKSRNEEIDPNFHQAEEGAMTEEPEALNGYDEHEPPTPFVHTYEDFLRRFPEPQDVRQSMQGPAVSPGPPPPPFHPDDLPHPPAPSRPIPAVPRPSYSGVSDGRRVQPPLERQYSATKTALYSSPIDRMKLPRTGLVNFGATCYMNSIIQCLSASLPLTKFFMDNRFHSQVQKNWLGSLGVLPGLYANLIRSLWKGDVEVIRPTSFRKFCGRLNSEWEGNTQQDAKEFFDVVIDCLHEDLNRNWRRTRLLPLTTEQELRREQMPMQQVSTIEWNRYTHRELSHISSLFAGQHASRLRCTTCHRTSTTYEAFYSISVEIPPQGRSDLSTCLRSYCQEELLRGAEAWKCPYCREERAATKQIILTRAPRFLVVHFKRFSASARKIHSLIQFPISGLDIGPFMMPTAQKPPPPPVPPHHHPHAPPPPSVDGSSTPPPHHHQLEQPQQPPPDPSTTPPYKYNAYAIVRHIGASSSEGHYISLVRDARRGCWRKFDDTRVTDFIPNELNGGGGGGGGAGSLCNEQAYIVFYERVLAN